MNYFKVRFMCAPSAEVLSTLNYLFLSGKRSQVHDIQVYNLSVTTKGFDVETLCIGL